jgi:hypothetical protein
MVKTLCIFIALFAVLILVETLSAHIALALDNWRRSR